jgi:two-component system, NtrC family, response regulator HydG
MPTRVLFVDDQQDICDVFALALAELGYDVTAVTSATEALEKIGGAEEFDVVLTDLHLKEMTGTSLCERILGARPDTPVVIVTGQSSVESATLAMRAGAIDFLVKPVDLKLLERAVARAVRHRHIRVHGKRHREAASTRSANVVGESPAMKRVDELVGRVAGSDISVLIRGETGTGKELVARSIHAGGARKDGPFVAINCAAVPAPLLESELFGHARGAFTDAKVQRTGLFLQANGGTLLLDEIGELPLEVQPKLLRALQERTVRPVGGDAEHPFDARILAATNRDLEHEVSERRFREDLYYRLNVVQIDIPPLRERRQDVLALAHHLLRKLAERTGSAPLTISVPAAERLVGYAWPGNVRELENCVERAVALARYNQITVEDLPERMRTYHAEGPRRVEQPSEVATFSVVAHRHVLHVLSLVDGNKTLAAAKLGVDRRTLYRMLAKYDEAAVA